MADNIENEVQTISLKEAFRYQSFLKDILLDAVSYLSATRNITTVQATHMRQQVNPDAKDEIVTVEAEHPIPGTIDDLVDFVQFLLDSRDELAAAITEAKRAEESDIDSMCSLNKTRQHVARVLTNASRTKASERIVTGTAYKFNAEGNQTAYRYDIKEVSSINFDRNKMRKLAERIISYSDRCSADVDRILLEAEVEFDPPFSLNCSWEEAFETYLKEYADDDDDE